MAGRCSRRRATLLGERWGLLWLTSEALLVALVVAGLRGAARSAATRPVDRERASLLTALAVAHVANGHAANVARPVAHVLAGAVHLLAAGVWLGGVAALALTLWPTAGTSRRDAAVLARAVRTPFGALAGGALLVAVLTGLIAAGTQVASVDALLTTNYGESLLAKSALMAAAGLFGLANAVLLLRGGDHVASGRVSQADGDRGRARDRRAARGRRDDRLGARARAGVRRAAARPRTRSSRVRSRTSSSPPPRGPTASGRTSSPSRRRTRGGSTAPRSAASSIVLRPQAGGAARTLALTGTGAGRWTGGAVLNGAGGWRMTVLVRRPGATLAAPLAWRVEPADTVIPVRYSARRLAPITNRIALVLAIAAVTGVLLLLVVPPPSLRSHPPLPDDREGCGLNACRPLGDRRGDGRGTHARRPLPPAPRRRCPT